MLELVCCIEVLFCQNFPKSPVSSVEYVGVHRQCSETEIGVHFVICVFYVCHRTRSTLSAVNTFCTYQGS